MRLFASHNEHDVVIVAFLYEGEDNENLKAVYVNEDGEIDADDAANFEIIMSVPTDDNFVEAVRNMKVKSW